VGHSPDEPAPSELRGAAGAAGAVGGCDGGGAAFRFGGEPQGIAATLPGSLRSSTAAVCSTHKRQSFSFSRGVQHIPEPTSFTNALQAC
jgi:hypothetical protein